MEDAGWDVMPHMMFRRFLLGAPPPGRVTRLAFEFCWLEYPGFQIYISASEGLLSFAWQAGPALKVGRSVLGSGPVDAAFVDLSESDADKIDFFFAEMAKKVADMLQSEAGK